MTVREAERSGGGKEPQWYRDAVIYELPVRAFFDALENGMGDFPGLTTKLDYLQDLGVTAIWLLPFYPSPMKDDGYDISDYTGIQPVYGTMRDFRRFLREAHRRGLRVLVELVLNHSSDQHPWFQRARRAKPGSVWRDYYVWSDTPERYADARIIFKDFETSNWTWDPIAKAYYWHRFYAHQPDLNYENPRVRAEIVRVVDFWLGMGVDGLRLDAVPYLYEQEGTNCENLPETHAFLRELRRHVDAEFPDRVLLAEANQWPEDAATYFGKGDECQMAFHFPLMPRLFMGIRLEDRFPIVEILKQTPPIPADCQWALFLRNHDELTLEMVTDEERDYMYRMYAKDEHMRINLGIRRRLAPLLENDRRSVELMVGLLLSLPGTPVLYYGDEIGMGDNFHLGDRNGVRTPMQWSSDRNAGFSRVNPQKLYLPVIIDSPYHYEVVNVETQQGNPSSLLWWTKRLIAQRKRFQAFGRGTLEILAPQNPKVLAFLRRHEAECVLVVANLSRHAQHVQLDLKGERGLVPVELGGGTAFPPIGEVPYSLTLGPHDFYWFSLESPSPAGAGGAAWSPGRIPLIDVRGAWPETLEGPARAALEDALREYLPTCRWYGGKDRPVQTLDLADVIPVPHDGARSTILLIRLEYTDGEEQRYVLPLGFASGDRAALLLKESPRLVVARVHGDEGSGDGVLFDAFWDPAFLRSLLDAILHSRRLRGTRGDIGASRTQAFRALLGPDPAALEPTPLKVEQTNTSARYGDRLLLKLYRRLDAGVNPELEMGWFLTARARFDHAPALAGALEYVRRREPPATLAVLEAFVPSQGDAWQHTLDSLAGYLERAMARGGSQPAVAPPRKGVVALSREEPPADIAQMIGPYLEEARLLGRRTAELHLALSQATDDPTFAPELQTAADRRARYHSRIALMDQTLSLLRQRLAGLPPETREDAAALVDQEEGLRNRFATVRDRSTEAMRIRCHGDYHLGQVLFTGKDFVIIDFEGEPARPTTERRIKRLPLRDVAGMIRSFHYAVEVARMEHSKRVPENRPGLEPWLDVWDQWVSAAFLRAYLEGIRPSSLLPEDPQELQILLDGYLLEKAVYEIGYELQSRPDWVRVPIRGVLELLGSAG